MTFEAENVVTRDLAGEFLDEELAGGDLIDGDLAPHGVVSLTLARHAAERRQRDGDGAGSWKSLATFWTGLVEGTHRVVRAFTHVRGHYAVAGRGVSGPLSARERMLLHRAFLGQSQKSLASELGVSGTTVSVLIGRSLDRIGLERRICAAPLPVVLGALDHLGMLEPPSGACAGAFEAGEGRYMVASVPVFDPGVLRDLTDAERSVARLIAEGMCQKAIAASRGTSLRTVANQIASLSRKLDVGGRFALLRRWAELEGWARPVQLINDEPDRDGLIPAAPNRVEGNRDGVKPDEASHDE
jgi:DNA-binding NarL/FixJ family response regulator